MPTMSSTWARARARTAASRRQGTPADRRDADSLTGPYLSGKQRIAVPRNASPGRQRQLRLLGARGNNLKRVDLESRWAAYSA